MGSCNTNPSKSYKKSNIPTTWKMLKHRFSKSQNLTLVSDLIVSGNITNIGADHLDIDDTEMTFDECKVKTSTKRHDMEEDLAKVWDLLSSRVSQQKERENTYPFPESFEDKRHRRASLDSSEIFAMDETKNTTKDQTLKFNRSMSRDDILWNGGDQSGNAMAEPWVMKYKFDQDGFKIYEDIEFNSSFNDKTFEGSFISFSSDSSFSKAVNGNPHQKKRGWKRSISKVLARPMKIR